MGRIIQPPPRRGRTAYLLVAVWNKAVESLVLAKIAAQHGRIRPLDRRVLSAVHRLMLRQVERMAETGAEPAATRASGVHNSTVVLSPPDTKWPSEAATEADRLGANLGLCAKIHHIGSTAIEGLAAKPIIDLAIALPAENFRVDFARTRGALERAGYRYLGVRGGYFFEKAHARVRTHAVQVHRAGSPELAELLRFRDALQATPALRAEYARVKALLAAHFPRRRLLYVTYKFHWIAEWQWRSAGAPDWSTWFVDHKRSQARLAAQS